jgi:hypothetical protein
VRQSTVVVVSRPDYEAKRFTSSLRPIDIANGTQRTLTYERKVIASPRWSPSGDRLVFLALGGSDKEAKLQIFIMRMQRGQRVGMKKPKAAPIFLGLLMAALARMIWFWRTGKSVIDPIGLTSISLALIVLIGLAFFHSRHKDS